MKYFYLNFRIKTIKCYIIENDKNITLIKIIKLLYILILLTLLYLVCYFNDKSIPHFKNNNLVEDYLTIRIIIQ